MRQRGTAIVSLLTAVTLAGWGAAAAPASAATVDLAVNGTFDSTTDGWYLSSSGTLSWMSPGFARITNSTGKTTTMTLNDKVNTVGQPVAGQTYSGAVRVRTSNQKSQKVTLRMQEWVFVNSTWTMLGQSARTVTLSGTAWQNIATGYVAQQPGSTIDVNVVATSTPARATIDVDDIAVTTVVPDPNVPPVAAFAAQVSDLSVAVDASGSSDPDGSVVSYAWDFGDGSRGAGRTAQHVYAAAGQFPVTLTVTDDKGATTSVTQQVTATAPAIVPPAGWHLYWSDEFDGSALDTSRWTAYHNTYGDGNAELACLTPGNVAQTGGAMTITSRKETVTCPSGSVRQYTSGFIGSRESGRYYPLYGRYEIRARVPHGQGLWPAFWLRHRSGSGVAEVDVMEYFFSQVPGRTTQTLHFPSTVGRNVAKKSTFFETPVRGTGGWHTWAVEIEPVTGSDGTRDVRFRFLLDGTQTLEYTNTQPEAWNGGDPNATWDIAVNTAVGGNYTGYPEQQLGWLPGPKVCSLTYKAPTNGDPALCPTDGIWFADLPGRYDVDYVRVFTR